MDHSITRLLQRVAVRLRVASLGRWFYLFMLWLGGAYALALIVMRILALLPGWFTPPTLLILVVLAMVLAGIFHRRFTPMDAARAIDARTGAKDVFLTAAVLERSPGEFKPLVLLEARKRAAEVRPGTVVPMDAWRPAGVMVACLLGLLLAVLFFNPGWDPLGAKKVRQEEAQRRQRLDDSIKEVSLRAQTLQDKSLDAQRSKDVDAALEQLKQTFNQMKPQDPANNLRQLRDQEDRVGQMWTRAAEERLRDSMDQPSSQQRFGSAETAKSKQWADELKQGKTDSLQKEAESLRTLAQKMQNEKDPVAKAQQQAELQKRLQDMSDFVNNQAGRQSLKDAISRAQQQLSTTNNSALAAKAAEALAQSMALTQSELKSLGQSVRDFQSLQQALQAIQQAKMANSAAKGGQGKGLDGKELSSAQSMDDYIKMFNQMQSLSPNGMPTAGMIGDTPGGMNNGGGQGLSMNGAPSGPNSGGQGSGYRPQGSGLKVGFKDEKDNSRLTAGKMLLEWKEKGLNEKGEVRKEYVQAIRDLKQGVSEAILKEEIPPGYHDPIQKYFDDMEKVLPAPPGAGVSGTSGASGGAAPTPAPAAPAPATTNP